MGVGDQLPPSQTLPRHAHSLAHGQREPNVGVFYSATGERSPLESLVWVGQTQLEIKRGVVLSRNSGGKEPWHPDESLECAQSLIARLAGLLLAKRVQCAAVPGGTGLRLRASHSRLLEMPFSTGL